VNLLFIVLAVAAAISVISLLAIFKLREKYMITWIGLAIFVFLFGVFFKQVNSLTENL
jgi:hypothetical protein